MTTLDLRKLESALQMRAVELARSLAQRGQIAVERLADTLDATLEAAERESSAQVLAEESRLLREVEAARDRVRKGAFGICQCCEEPIAVKRLQAIPWAAFCRSCQEKEEEGAPAVTKWARAA